MHGARRRGAAREIVIDQGRRLAAPTRCEDSIGCMHGSSEPDLRNWKS
ncbi:hypothetical protein L564_2845, partial [Bordetella pertussis CHLA-15]